MKGKNIVIIEEFVLNILVIAVAIYFAIDSFNFPERARWMPLLVTVPLILLIITQLIKSIPNFLQRQKEHDHEVYSQKWQEFIIFMWISLLAVLILLTGFLVGIILYLMIFLVIKNKEKLKTSILITLFTVVAVYVIFVFWLGIPLYEGLIFIAIKG